MKPIPLTDSDCTAFKVTNEMVSLLNCNSLKYFLKKICIFRGDELHCIDEWKDDMNGYKVH